jgi:hypothetical protein
MALQTGNAGNITALDPTVIAVAESPAYNNSWNDNWHYRAAFSYITGSHQFKVGFNNASGHFENLNYDVNPICYTFTSGVPTSITIKDSPYTVQVDVDRDLGFFVQDRWTLQRWSLYGGIRYDSFKNSFPAQDLLPSKYVPNRPVTHFAAQDNISWNDITPKLGASYDVFGNGKTAFKVSLNKYLLGYGTLGFFENGLSSNPHPINTLTTNTSIGWNDANHDLVPPCNLLNPAANGECTGWANPGFGSLVPTTTYDPNLLTGWGKRNRQRMTCRSPPPIRAFLAAWRRRNTSSSPPGLWGVPTALRWWRRSGYSRSWSLERSGWIGSTSSTSAFQKSSGLASRGRT